MENRSAVCVHAGEQLARYGFGQGHPFGPDRFDAFWDRFVSEGLDRQVVVCEPVLAEQQDLLLFHTPDYVEQVRAQSRTGSGFLDYGDTPAFRGMFEATSYVVGSVLDALNRIVQRRCRRGFVPIAGLHHGRADSGAGFCVFNDCAVAIQALRKRHGIRRVAYVDIDAHHADGVFYAFESDPDLVFADFHEDGRVLYPGTGAATETGRGRATGTKLNLPMPPFADDQTLLEAWPPVEHFVEQAAPEFILFQCGADSLAGDPLTHLQYTSAAHAHVARSLCGIADRCCQGRLLALGGGGYNRENLAAAWTAVVREMARSAPQKAQRDDD